MRAAPRWRGRSADRVYAVGANTMGTVIVAGGEGGVVRIWDQKRQSITTFAPRRSIVAARD